MVLFKPHIVYVHYMYNVHYYNNFQNSRKELILTCIYENRRGL